MKLKYKIRIIILLVSAIALALLINFLRSNNLRDPLHPRSKFLSNTADAKHTSPASLQRYSTVLPESPAISVANELSRKLCSCAESALLQLLPEGAVILPPDSRTPALELLDDHTAIVSGQAAVPATHQQIEQRFSYQIKVNFLPDGSCSAAFPAITRLTN